MNDMNWDRLAEGFDLSKLGVPQPEESKSPKKAIEFAREWVNILNSRNPSVEVQLNFSLSGQKAKVLLCALAYFRFMLERNPQAGATQDDFLEDVLIGGAIDHCRNAQLLVDNANAMSEFIRYARENPEEIKESYENIIEGTGRYSDFIDDGK